ncbi:MAG: glycosyltransferase [Candidatus Promineifilaceae bacterium]
MMKILLLTPQEPYPPHQGTSLRNFYILKGLSLQHEITLLTFRDFLTGFKPATTTILDDLCQEIYTVPAPNRTMATRLKRLFVDRRPDMAHRLESPAFNTALTQLLTEQSFDVVQIEGIELAQSMALVRQHSPHSRLIFDDHNAETELQRRAFLTDLRHPTRWPAALYSWIQVGRLRRFERWACQTADAVTVVSETDAAHIRSLGVTTSVTVIPNSLDIMEYRTRETEPAFDYDLIFSGKMDYRPNIDAVLWFADEIWPFLKEKRPQITWVIVGQKPHARLERLKEMSGITITGWVESVQPYLAGAAVYVMPFRMGSGTRLKLIEAMAAGKAIVSTPVGAEGFPVTHDRELLLADDPVQFAESVLALLEAGERREELGKKAAEFAEQYDWRVIVPAFEEAYKL